MSIHLKISRKNNFYGLPNFEKFWNDAKAYGDGIGLDM